MADYELHADYDRNGRLDASRPEYGRRMAAPGAILVPNMDADGRALPASVIPGSRVVVDGRQPIAPATDDEQLPLRILVRNASATAGTRFFLRPTGFPKIRLRFNDAGGRMLPRDLARDDDLPIAVPSAPGALDLRLSTHTLPGSPIGHVTNLNTKFSLNDDDESMFQVELISVDASGAEQQLDMAQFSIAPFVILDHSATALRTYMAESLDNEPSVTEMEAAHRAIGVPLLRVPASVATDTWLQDQFQHALIQGPDRWRQVIVHMPRLRRDTSSGTTPINLANFVLSHFPSRDIGVFNDLWDRTVQVFDVARAQHRIPFVQCVNVAAEMKRAEHLFSRAVNSISALDPTASIDFPETWSGTMARIPDLVTQFSRLATRATGSAEWLARVEATRVDLVARRNDLQRRIPFNGTRAGIPVNGSSIELTVDDADRLYRRLQQMRSSSNYGGNLEASPPTANAPLGKLVIGNVTVTPQSGDEWDFMDPDLLRLLYKQAKQPIVQLNTIWLHVGHVDEVMTFAPDRANPGGGGFAVLEASPALGMQILRSARDRFLAGLTPAERLHFDHPPSGTSTVRYTDLGTSPMTRLHRGKLWAHRHEARTGDQVPDIHEPPQVYQRLSQFMSGSAATTTAPGGINIWGLRYWPGEGPERTYPADITVPELLFAEKDDADVSTNDFIATTLSEFRLDVAAGGFPGAAEVSAARAVRSRGEHRGLGSQPAGIPDQRLHQQRGEHADRQWPSADSATLRSAHAARRRGGGDHRGDDRLRRVRERAASHRRALHPASPDDHRRVLVTTRGAHRAQLGHARALQRWAAAVAALRRARDRRAGHRDVPRQLPRRHRCAAASGHHHAEPTPFRRQRPAAVWLAAFRDRRRHGRPVRSQRSGRCRRDRRAGPLDRQLALPRAHRRDSLWVECTARARAAQRAAECLGRARPAPAAEL